MLIDEPEGFGMSGTAGFRRSAVDLALTPLGRIFGLIGLLAVLCACLWAIAQYAEHKAEIRRAETERYIQAFEAGPVADAWAKLRQRWDAPGSRTYGLRAGALETELEAEIETMLGYFRGFALCVRAGNCDLEQARIHLGELPERFLAQHRDHLEANFASVRLDRELKVLLPQEGVEPLWP